MSSAIKLTEPTIQKTRIERSFYGTLPDYVQNLVSGYDHIWSVLVTPGKTSDSGIARVVISAAENGRSGNLKVNNNGRVPETTPPADQDDLRPASYYVWDLGAQTFKVYVPTRNSIWVSTDVLFD